jgi:membrane-bound serine protease (ClpP class)
MVRILFLLLLSLNSFAQYQDYPVRKILKVEINSSINPATYSYLKEAYARAFREDYEILLIKLNTPGGLVSITKDILTLMGGSETTTIVWITPEGASATSAGAIIASGAHILLMANGTNIGSATPIELTGEIKETDQRKKAINSLVGLVQSLAESRGRNPEAFGKMVRDAVTYKSHEAMQNRLIDGIADKESDVIKILDNRLLTRRGQTFRMVPQNPVINPFEMDMGQNLLDILANPSMAYILFLIGAALIYLEFQAPGGYVAGSIGSVCLILAALGFQVLPLNFGAIGLILLSFILFFLEMYIVSHGLLTLMAVISLVTGSLFLFRTDNAYMELSNTVIFSAVSAISLFIILMGAYIFWDKKQHKLRENFYSKLGKHVVVSAILQSDEPGWFFYHVKFSGEIWKAKSKTLYKEGDSCKVLKEDTEEMCLFI